MNGYTGYILNVDLSSGKIEKKALNPDDARMYIGGSGLGTKYLFELSDGETDPLGPGNPLIFMTGPLTGTKAFSSDRWQVVTKSPLTGGFGEANCGGKWGSTLKKSGFDGIIVTGKAEKPVYISIFDGEAAIEDASDLWGLDNFDTDDALNKKIERPFKAATIGQAGENLVRYACISSEGKDARVAGRSGCGAVMGAKNLKAIVTGGNGEFPLADAAGLKTFIKENVKTVASHPISVLLRDAGTSCGMVGGMEIGNAPIKNWGAIDFPDMEKIDGNTMRDTILKKRYYCGTCVVGCGRVISVEDGPYKTDGNVGGPEYESSGLLGSNLLINDLKAVCKLNELCNRYGMDTIGAGTVLGLVMDSFDRGYIKKEELDGIELDWGCADEAIEMIHKIGRAEGCGVLLGQGTLRIGRHFGKDVLALAPQVKGQDFAAHDPRAKVGTALAYVTSSRGACHMSAATSNFESCFPLDDLGYPESPDRFELEGKPKFVMDFQDFSGMYDSLPCCKFMAHQGVTLNPILEILNFITGYGFTAEEFLKTGARIFNLKRLYNNKCGFTRADDSLPERFTTHTIDGEEEIHMFAPMDELLDEYYSIRGWNSEGEPQQEILEELDLITVV